MKPKFVLFLCAAALFIRYQATAQNTFPNTGAAGIGTTTPDASSLLEIRSISKGFLPPRMTLAQRNAITTPATGLLIYQTNTGPGFYYYNGSVWKAVGSWTVNGSNVYYNGGNVGIGTSTPTLGGLVVDTKADAVNAMFGSNTTGVAIESSFPGIGLNTYYNSGRKFIAGGFGGYIGLDPTSGVMSFGNTSASGTANATAGINTNMSITAAGNVGIGTAAPAGKLDVRGDAYINGIRIGRGNGNLSNNTVVGASALANNTSGNYNLAMGTYALLNNTTGVYNTAGGFGSLYANSTGSSNTAYGYDALFFNASNGNCAFGDLTLFDNTAGSFNTAVGSSALTSNTIGNDNVATGEYALHFNTTGTANVANGRLALESNTTGNLNVATGASALAGNTEGGENVAVGDESLLANTTGGNNTAVGSTAMYYNTTGNSNTALGATALFNNRTGYSNIAIGTGALELESSVSNLVAIGDSALFTDNIGAFNVATGSKALYSNLDGNQNTANGYHALQNNYAGNNNTAVGFNALVSSTTGSNNTCIGANAYPLTTTLTNYTGIGYNVGSSSSASNMVEIGNSLVTVIRGQVNFSTYSDERIKKNIQNNVPGLAFINLLKPATYNIDLDKENTIAYKDKKTDSNDKNLSTGSGIDSQLKTGFLAQEVEAAAKKVNYDFSGIVKPQNENDLYSLRYAEFVVPLVKAVQELSKQNDSLKNENGDLEKKYEAQQKQIDELKELIHSSNLSSLNSTSRVNAQTVELGSVANLSQNVPNPFSNSTIINYYLPVNNGNVYINFYGENGMILKSIKISGNGKGSVNLKADQLPAGVYRYALLINGKITDSKEMISVK